MHQYLEKVEDTSMSNGKLYMRFRLTPRSMTLDDLELLYVRIFSEFRVISQIWDATTDKRMKRDPLSATEIELSPLNVLFINV